MSRPKVYIDGQAGTTGLQIYDRLAARSDIQLLQIDESKRKDPEERKRLLNEADIVFLCLPDAAAVEAVGMIENPAVRVIDASTAHRTALDWDYGFPELSRDHGERIRRSKRVANPGCHATGFISVVYPLVTMGLLSRDTLLSCFSLTGYSGGGKKMIAQYEAPDRSVLLDSPSIYAMGQTHKHLPEMQVICGLNQAPIFCPIVDDYYKGMATTVPLHRSQLTGVQSLRQLQEAYRDYYADSPLILVDERGEGSVIGSVYANARAGADDLVIAVAGNDERITVTAVFDNLGKGASGAAVENMNLMLGLDPLTGLSYAT